RRPDQATAPLRRRDRLTVGRHAFGTKPVTRARAWLDSALFPLAYSATTSSLTFVFIGLGLLGNAALAADLALAQGAVIATFLAFSANLRNLILQRSGNMQPGRVLAARLLVLPPLCILAYVLGVEVAAVPVTLTMIVLVRRSCEWLAEVDVNVLELRNEKSAALHYLVVQAIAPLLVISAAWVFPEYLTAMLVLWALSPLPLVLLRLPKGEHLTA